MVEAPKLDEICDALRVELGEDEDVVESWRSSRLSKVWRVASGAKETRRLAKTSQRAPASNSQGHDPYP